jgi:calpastatin
MNIDLFDLERFVKVQDAYDSYDIALQEIKNGRKESHWMWYIFPQVQGLGHSSMSQRYSIKSLLEAKAFLEDDTLGKRLYETMSALPVYGDAEDIFGALDAMKLRSCLTLFDLVSPDDIFSDFLENYFNKERCQKTLKIVASELSYYKEDNAFQRNGIHEPARAFFESGICEAEQIDYEQRIGTLWDLLRRGETMRKLLSKYFWTKDFSVYRVSGVRSTILGYVRTVFQEIADNVHDDALFKEMNGIYNQYQLADDDSVFLIADAIDEFMKAHCDDKDIKSVLDTLIKDSLCLPIVKCDERTYNGIIRPEHTPDTISSLKSDEIFVFGSNLHGHHGGGAARAACKKFGAIWGQGVGLQGQSYAIPTMQGGVETIKPYVDQFIEFAKEHTELFFYVTRIGCGIAGFRDSDMAPLFREAIGIKNVCLPKSFW